MAKRAAIPILFLCGPMNLKPQAKWRLFLQHEKICHSRGFTTLNPIRNLSEYYKNFPLQKFPADTLRIDLSRWRDYNDHLNCQMFMSHCNGLYLIHGWGLSNTAAACVLTAKEFNMPIYTLINSCVIKVDYMDLDYYYGLFGMKESTYEDDDEDEDDYNVLDSDEYSIENNLPFEKSNPKKADADDYDDEPIRFSARRLMDDGYWFEKQMKPKK